MTKPPDKFTGALALQITVLVALISILAILLAPNSGHASNSPPTDANTIALRLLDQPVVAYASQGEQISFISSADNGNEPAPFGGNSAGSPDSASDIDDNDGDLGDLSANDSTHNNHDMPLVSLSVVRSDTLCAPRSAPMLSVYSFYCLHQQIRERAPPSLGYKTRNLSRVIPAHSATTRFADKTATLAVRRNHICRKPTIRAIA